jgi:cyclopropane fatty-acyl-phospholipid synthase-like methyltransferase
MDTKYDEMMLPPRSRAENSRRVVNYFDGIRFDVSLFWTDATTLGIHFGYWHSDTRSHREALRNTNRVLADRVALRRGQHVLDAGCGLGGSAIWLAEQYGVHVTGITLSHDQARRASRAAARRGVAHLVNFAMIDFQLMALPADTFDIVWSIDAAAYSWDKSEFVREAYRLLHPGGRLVLIDGFRTRRPFSADDESFMQRFAIGWGTPDYVTAEEMLGALQASGFSDLRFDDVSKHAEPTINRLHLLGGLAAPLARLLNRLGLISTVRLRNAESCYMLRELVDRRLGIYGIVSACK